MPVRSKRCAMCGERFKIAELTKSSVVGADLQVLHDVLVCKTCQRSDSRKKRVL